VSVKKNFLYNAGYQVLNIIVPIITIPYLARTLGQAGIGVFSYANTASNYFAMFITLGLSMYGVREIARCGTDRAERSRTFWSLYAFQAFMAVVVLAVYACYLTTLDTTLFLPSLMWGIWIVSVGLDISWLFFGCEEFRLPTVRAAALRLASTVAIFLFVKTPDDAWIYSLCIAAGQLASQALLWPFLRRHVDPVRPALADVARRIPPNLRLFVPLAAVSVYTAAGPLFLGWFSTYDQVGLFTYSQKLCQLSLAVITSLGSVMMPRMTGVLAKGDTNEAHHLLALSSWATLVPAWMLMWGIVAIAPEFPAVFFGPGYEETTSLMIWLAPTIPLMAFTNVLGNQYLIPSGNDRAYSASLVAGVVVFVAACFALIPSLGAFGAVLATDLTETAVLVVQVVAARDLPLARYVKATLPFFGFGFAMFAAVRGVAALAVPVWGDTIPTLALEIVVAGCVFIALSAVWCRATKSDYAKAVLGERLCRKLLRY
jgi:O-antigen/teichoic acid export membrane protein